MFLLTSVTAEKVILKPGESYSDEDKNITLLKLENFKALVCVNNQKGIVAKDKRIDINGIIVEMTRYYRDSAKFDIEVPNCYKCECTEDCLNLLCQETQTPDNQIIDQNQQTNQNQEIQKIEIIESTGVSTASIIAVILIIIVALLGIYTLWKRIR